VRAGKYTEPAVLTSGDDLPVIKRFVSANLPCYSAARPECLRSRAGRLPNLRLSRPHLRRAL